MAAVLTGALIFAGCDKDKNNPTATPSTPVHEEEVITSMLLIFTDDAGNTKEWHAHTDDGFAHDHEHGDGGHDHDHGDVHIHGEALAANTNYAVRILLLNETVTPVDTVSNEVLDEGTAHQFFFVPEDVAIAVTYTDSDANGRPIGLQSRWAVGGAGTGEVKVILRHGLDKSAAGVAAGDITNAGGATDIEVHFPATIE